jgi:serine/threonine protein kinase
MLIQRLAIVHGDIKPDNVLVFEVGTDRYVAQVADFGYSSFVARGDDVINMPGSQPWAAPEYHHRGFTGSQAIQMDTFSFGMLCMWILFYDVKDFPEETQLEALKFEDKLYGTACELTMAVSGLEDERRERLKVLFKSTLVKSAEERDSDFMNLLQLLDGDRYQHVSYCWKKINSCPGCSPLQPRTKRHWPSSSQLWM